MEQNLKQCQNCGTFFNIENGRYKYCSNQCSEEARQRKLAAYYRLYNNCVDEYISNDIYDNEKNRSNSPNMDDIEDVLVILNDFGIKPQTIPKFNTYASLNQWKTTMLSKALS